MRILAYERFRKSYRQLPQQMVVDRLGLMGRTAAPGQYGLFRHTEHKADARQVNTDQEHLEGHHDLLFRGPQIKENRIACLREALLALGASQDTAFPTVRHIRGDCADVALMHTIV